jgi:hypothetical protein
MSGFMTVSPLRSASSTTLARSAVFHSALFAELDVLPGDRGGTCAAQGGRGRSVYCEPFAVGFTEATRNEPGCMWFDFPQDDWSLLGELAVPGSD